MRNKERNEVLRSAASSAGICLWELADKMGITDSTLSKKLRKQFTAEETEKALRLIDEIVAEREGAK